MDPRTNIEEDNIVESPALLFELKQADHEFWVVASREELSGDYVGSVGFKIFKDGTVEVGNPPHGMFVDGLKRGRGNAVRLIQQALSASKIVWNSVLELDGHPNCVVGIQGDGNIENCRHFWVDRICVPEEYLHIYTEPTCNNPDSRSESKNNLDAPNLMYRIDGRIYGML